VISGGGGGTSSKAGGANDGARIRCIGRRSRPLGCSGRVNSLDPLVKLGGTAESGPPGSPGFQPLGKPSRSDDLFPLEVAFDTGAPGQPHSNSSARITGPDDEVL